jgi:hypothetical protein
LYVSGCGVVWCFCSEEDAYLNRLQQDREELRRMQEQHQDRGDSFFDHHEHEHGLGDGDMFDASSFDGNALYLTLSLPTR